MIDITLQQKIKVACDTAEMSLTGLGSKMGMSQAAISKRVKTGKFTQEELEEIGFPREITDVVQILSRNEKPKEDYNDYIERIIKSGNKDAYIVKLADLKHNMDISRIKKPTVKDFARIEKRYRPNYIKIQNKLNEMRK